MGEKHAISCTFQTDFNVGSRIGGGGKPEQKPVLMVSHKEASGQNSVLILVRKECLSLFVLSVEYLFLCLFRFMRGLCVFRILLTTFCIFLLWGYLEQAEGRFVPTCLTTSSVFVTLSFILMLTEFGLTFFTGLFSSLFYVSI